MSVVRAQFSRSREVLLFHPFPVMTGNLIGNGTWLFETTDFHLPDLKLETEHEGSLPENAAAA